jgi:hypothetical protein
MPGGVLALCLQRHPGSARGNTGGRMCLQSHLQTFVLNSLLRNASFNSGSCARVHVPIGLNCFGWPNCTLSNFLTFVLKSLLRNASFWEKSKGERKKEERKRKKGK